MVDEWVARYQAGDSLREIAGEDVDPFTVWSHLKARGVVLRDKTEAQIQAVTKHKRTPFSGNNLERAYLLGLGFGDLNALNHGRAVRVRVSTTHPEMAALFHSLFSRYGSISWYPREARLAAYEWTLECDLDSTFGFMIERLVPFELERLSPAEFVAFLAGLADAEGSTLLHLKLYGSHFEFAITNTEAELLAQVTRRPEWLGYSPCTEKKRQDDYRLGYYKRGEINVRRLTNQAEVCRLLAILPLRHGEKVAKTRLVSRLVCADSHGVGKGESEDWRLLTSGTKETVHSFVKLAGVELGRGTKKLRAEQMNSLVLKINADCERTYHRSDSTGQ
ncbi:MAG: hypothetical protein JRN06_04475 [Nitrososphaerota archaeon]|nr:hypothetical protein [Nitrososphaerota archaeon]MDG7023877.1 hypothetical protein [Nitrososphaerota archaeon]